MGENKNNGMIVKILDSSRDSNKIPKIPKILMKFQRFRKILIGFRTFYRLWKDCTDSKRILKIPAK